jgi:pimeloyl-ACP methyl ester carboxylesterase
MISSYDKEPRKTVASFDGVPISYEVQSSGKTRPSIRTMAGPAIEAIGMLRGYRSTNHYQIVTLDLAGHGQSGTGREAWTIASYGEDVAAVVEELDLENAILIGHSREAMLS